MSIAVTSARVCQRNARKWRAVKNISYGEMASRSIMYCMYVRNALWPAIISRRIMYKLVSYYTHHHQLKAMWHLWHLRINGRTAVRPRLYLMARIRGGNGYFEERSDGLWRRQALMWRVMKNKCKMKLNEMCVSWHENVGDYIYVNIVSPMLEPNKLVHSDGRVITIINHQRE